MPKQRLLAIETSTEALSVALWNAGQVSESHELAPRQHAAEVLSRVHRLLQEAGWGLGDLDALAVGTGPGSFTGIRIGIAVVQGLALGSQLPIYPVSSLMAMARGVHETSGARQVLCLLDARMGQVYVGGYLFDDAGNPSTCIAEAVCDPQQVVAPGEGDWALAGHGLTAYEAALRKALSGQVGQWLPDCLPRAAQIAALAARSGPGLAVSAAALEPTYVRNQVAALPAKKQGRAQPQD